MLDHAWQTRGQARSYTMGAMVIGLMVLIGLGTSRGLDRLMRSVDPVFRKESIRSACDRLRREKLEALAARGFLTESDDQARTLKR